MTDDLSALRNLPQCHLTVASLVERACISDQGAAVVGKRQIRAPALERKLRDDFPDGRVPEPDTVLLIRGRRLGRAREGQQRFSRRRRGAHKPIAPLEKCDFLPGLEVPNRNDTGELFAHREPVAIGRHSQSYDGVRFPAELDREIATALSPQVTPFPAAKVCLAGSHEKAVRMSIADYRKLVQPRILKFSYHMTS